MKKIALITDTHSKYSGNIIQSNTAIYHKINMLSPKVDAVLHCGDWIMQDRENNLNSAMQTMRECIDDDIPIFTVIGNHDAWSQSKQAYIISNELEGFFQTCCRNNDIIRVTPEGYYLEDICIRGFDGWYGVLNPPSTDRQNMELEIDSVPTHDFLMKKAYKDLEKILDKPDIPSIIMTHFPPFVEGDDTFGVQMSANLNYFDLILETNCKALCVGHSHRQYIGIHKNTLVLNPGGDYGNPNFLTFFI